MSIPFMGEMRWVSFRVVPKGWAACNGQTLKINQYPQLFSLLGTMYGGDGQTTFALPDMQGNTLINIGDEFSQGRMGGETTHTLSPYELPEHIHLLSGTADTARDNFPTSEELLAGAPMYGPPGDGLVSMNQASISNSGGSQPHNNMQPYLNLQCIIALVGLYPAK